jgi:hypothetical protein
MAQQLAGKEFMDALTPDQQKVKSRITTSAIVTGVIVGVVIAIIAYLIGGNWNTVMRWIVALVLGGGLGYLTYRLSYNSSVAKAVCPKCGTAFGISEVGRTETLIATETKQKVEAMKGNKLGGAMNKVTTWVEDKYEVTAIDECSNCHNRTERKWTTTKERDRMEKPA